MIEAIGYGLGFGLAFWLVMLPIALLVRTPKDGSFQKKLEGYWERSIEIGDKQLDAYLAMVAIMDAANKVAEKESQ